jgi:hypothetical protein
MLAVLQGTGDATGRMAMNYCFGHTEKFEASLQKTFYASVRQINNQISSGFKI